MLTGLTELRLTNCPNVTTEGLRAIKTLTSLSALNLSFSPSLATAVLRAVSSLSTLTHLHLTECRTLTRVCVFVALRSFCPSTPRASALPHAHQDMSVSRAADKPRRAVIAACVPVSALFVFLWPSAPFVPPRHAHPHCLILNRTCR